MGPDRSFLTLNSLKVVHLDHFVTHFKGVATTCLVHLDIWLFTIHFKIAVCSPNCVQIWKGRDQKTVLCRERHKNIMKCLKQVMPQDPTFLPHCILKKNPHSI